jgi:hypothetical protein
MTYKKLAVSHFINYLFYSFITKKLRLPLRHDVHLSSRPHEFKNSIPTPEKTACVSIKNNRLTPLRKINVVYSKKHMQHIRKHTVGKLGYVMVNHVVHTHTHTHSYSLRVRTHKSMLSYPFTHRKIVRPMFHTYIICSI